MEKVSKITKDRYKFLDEKEAYIKELSEVFNVFIKNHTPNIPKGYASVSDFSDGTVNISVKDPLILNELSVKKEYIKYELKRFDKSIKEVAFRLG